LGTSPFRRNYTATGKKGKVFLRAHGANRCKPCPLFCSPSPASGECARSKTCPRFSLRVVPAFLFARKLNPASRECVRLQMCPRFSLCAGRTFLNWLVWLTRCIHGYKNSSRRRRASLSSATEYA